MSFIANHVLFTLCPHEEGKQGAKRSLLIETITTNLGIFFLAFVFKQGPLGKVWLAATLGESRVPKAFASSANINILCQDIEKPQAPFALRLSASLMLGVVRVYSRKSTIILSDVNSILQLLSRYNTTLTLTTTTTSTSTSRKRPHPHHNIPLDGDRGLANFDQITLPSACKRRRHPTSNHDPIPVEWSLNLPDHSKDLLAAMDMDIAAFPSISIPNNQYMIGGTSSDNSQSGGVRRRSFHAREEDITIQQTSHDIFAPSPSNMPNVFQQNTDHLIGSQFLSFSPSALDDITRPLFQNNTPPQQSSNDINQNNLSSGEDGSGSANVTTPSPPVSSKNNIAEDLHNLIAPVDMQPLQLPTMPRLEDQHNHLESSSSKQSILPEPEEEEPLPPADNNGQEVRVDPDNAFSDFPVIDQAQAEQSKMTTTMVTGRGPRKSRRTSGEQVFDDRTEMTSYEFRAVLDDTSDIIIARGDRTQPRSSRNRWTNQGVTTSMVTVPSILTRFVPQVQLLWTDTVNANELQLLQPSSISGRTGGRRRHGGGGGGGTGAVNRRTVRAVTEGEGENEQFRNDNGGSGGGDGNTLDVQHVAGDMDEAIMPEAEMMMEDAGSVGFARTDSGSEGLPPEQMRNMENVENVVRPSGSGSGRRDGRLIQNARDALFNMVTPDDRHTYDMARTGLLLRFLFFLSLFPSFKHFISCRFHVVSNVAMNRPR